MGHRRMLVFIPNRQPDPSFAQSISRGRNGDGACRHARTRNHKRNQPRQFANPPVGDRPRTTRSVQPSPTTMSCPGGTTHSSPNWTVIDHAMLTARVRFVESPTAWRQPWSDSCSQVFERREFALPSRTDWAERRAEWSANGNLKTQASSPASRHAGRLATFRALV